MIEQMPKAGAFWHVLALMNVFHSTLLRELEDGELGAIRK
jgi:hypothetical protein